MAVSSSNYDMGVGKMKKRIVLGVVMLLVLSGIASADPYWPGGCGGVNAPEMAGPDTGMPLMRGNFAKKAENPAIREKMDEIMKLNDEIMTELHKSVPDKSKARKLHDRVQDITQEIEDMRFNDRLSNPEPPKRPDVMGNKVSPQQKENIARIRDLSRAIKEELRKENPDKSKAKALHEQVQKLRRELDTARFEEVLKNPSGFYKGQAGRLKIPAAIKTQMAESNKLRFEIMEEMQKDIPNKAKIRELNKNLQKIRNNIDDEMLEEMLKSPDKFRNGPMGPGMGRDIGCPGGGHHREWMY